MANNHLRLTDVPEKIKVWKPKIKEKSCPFCEMRLNGYHKESPCKEFTIYEKNN